MKQFVIYYSRNNDLGRVVATYHHHASAWARRVRCTISLADIDVDQAQDDDKKSWGGSRIECVTVQNGTVISRATDPTLSQIEELIQGLCQAGSDSTGP